MSYPYPPMGPGQQPPGGWGGTPPPPQGGYGGYGPGGYGQPPSWQGPEMMPPMGPPPQKKGSAGVIIAVICAAVVFVGAVLGGAYYLASSSSESDPSSSPSARSSSSTGGPPVASGGQAKPGYYNSMDSWSLWNSLNTQAQDNRPLTLDEVFSDPEAKSQKDTIDGTNFNVQPPGRLDTDCGSTVWGASLKAALTTYGCTQVVRATYVSDNQRWVGQLAIFNLRDVTSANALLDDLDPKTGKGFFLPIAGAPPADKFGQGSTGAESGAYGHFVVVGWAGRADGSTGSSLSVDSIAPSSAVQQAGKEFLFHRN
jgi:hypothetical protein